MLIGFTVFNAKTRKGGPPSVKNHPFMPGFSAKTYQVALTP